MGKHGGSKNPMFGKHHTEEALTKMRANHGGGIKKGTMCPQDRREKISISVKAAYEADPDYSKKISESNKRRLSDPNARLKFRNR